MAEKKKVNQTPQQDFVLLSPFSASQQSSRFVKLKGIAVANLTALNVSVVYLFLGEASGQCCQQ
jgi:hypothetical protein